MHGDWQSLSYGDTVVSSSQWRGRNVLITGGAGFIGSTLAIRLCELGADVTVVDCLIPEYGGNLFRAC